MAVVAGAVAVANDVSEGAMVLGRLAKGEEEAEGEWCKRGGVVDSAMDCLVMSGEVRFPRRCPLRYQNGHMRVCGPPYRTAAHRIPTIHVLSHNRGSFLGASK